MGFVILDEDMEDSLSESEDYFLGDNHHNFVEGIVAVVFVDDYKEVDLHILKVSKHLAGFSPD